MPILQGTKRNMEKEREKRKTRIRSFCVENQSPILLSETTFCLTSLLLPPDCRNRQNISKLFNLKKRIGKQMMGSSAAFFFICFLFTFFCVCFCQRERVGKHLPLSSLGEAGHSGNYQQQAYCYQTPSQALKGQTPVGSHF